MTLKEIQAVGISFFTLLAAYFDSTITFVFALLGAFAFNILAGMKADEVKIKLSRVSWFRVLRLTNFSGNKLKDSLAELCLIFFCTYFIITCSSKSIISSTIIRNVYILS